MRTRHTVLEAYTQADEEQRLYMFLSHRDLRQEFFAIDAGGMNCGKAETGPSKTPAQRDSSLQRAASCCWGLLKCCRTVR